ncbi:MAG TPA: LamG domain-containing protein [Polyangia bacterium]
MTRRGSSVLLACLIAACTETNPRFRSPDDVGLSGPNGANVRGDGGSGFDTAGWDPSSMSDGGFSEALPSHHDAGSSDTTFPTVVDAAIEAPTQTDGTSPVPPLDAAKPDAAAPMDVLVPVIDVAPVADLAPVIDAAPTLNSGLIGYWRFDEPDQALTIRDSSGFNHHGQIEGTTSGAGFVNGRFSRAYHITQSNRDFGIRVEATPAIKNIRQYTLAAWVYRYTTRAEYNTIISRQLNATDAEVMNLSISHDVAKLYASDRTPTKEVTVAWSRTPAPVGVWFHVAGTFDGSNLALYQNGVLVDKVAYAVPQPPTETPLYLATNKNPNETQPFYGILDEVMLYDVPLSPGLIAALARGERPAVP